MLVECQCLVIGITHNPTVMDPTFKIIILKCIYGFIFPGSLFLKTGDVSVTIFPREKYNAGL